jgi:hypothetical protein
LQDHRNLCEDFISVTSIDDEEISFCFDVDVTPDADIERVQAEIFYAIENYLNPPIYFYTLKELLDKKIPVDEIFNGPVLEHGFIETEQLEKTNLRSVIYTSDIINLVMDIEGVTAVRNFLMTKYDEAGQPVDNFKNLKWCMKITPDHKPVLRIDRSKIILFKDLFPFRANYDEVRDSILFLHALQSRNKLTGLQDDLPVPAGLHRDTESYWPVQYDFPLTYGIGEAGLPLAVSNERRAQQHQLKAYLMFYEQLLADFFSQLSNAYLLFSTKDIKHTYHAQFLNDIAGIKEDIYKRDAANSIMLEDVLGDPDSTKQPKSEWQGLYEPKDLFEDRRSRFLDHLLARFAESFNEYAMLMYRIKYDKTSNSSQQEKIGFNKMTGAKIKTLNNYPDISANRGKAYDYFPQDAAFGIDNARLWDTDNVSGLEKRICSLAAIENEQRRFLYCMRKIKIVCNERKEGDVMKCYHSFSVTTLEGMTMVSEEYVSKADAEKARLDAITFGGELINYLFDTVGSELQLIGGGTGTTGAILLKKKYDDKPTAMSDAAKFAAEFSKECIDPAGLHLIEHILLRPRDIGFDLMQVCLHGCDCLCELDPYSFRASVVLPYWPDDFDNMYFRQYFENKIREEAPAHVMLKVCWLDYELMREFEVRYKRWIDMLARYSFNKKTNRNDFLDANNKMVEILKNLHSEYPLASLHDCEESEEPGNVVVLGRTVLGTFKN